MRVQVLALLAALAAPSCQRPNPDFCDEDRPCPQGYSCTPQNGDGRRRCQALPDAGPPCDPTSKCPDEHPLCDPAGGRCRACIPGEDDLCRLRDAARPRCLGPGCVECLPGPRAAQSADCRAAAPVCDPGTAACRPCRLHAECRSGVCAKDASGAALGVPEGACVPEEQVLVIDQSVCNDMGPVFCTPAEAVRRLDSGHRYLVFRRAARNMEVLFSGLEIGKNETQRGIDLHLIGPLADGPPDQLDEAPAVTIGGRLGSLGLFIWPRTRVTLEGLLIAGAQVGVECLGDRNMATELRIVRSLLGDNRMAVSLKNACHLTLVESWVGRRPPRGGFAGVGGNTLALEVLGSDLDIENSVLAGNGAGDSFGGIYIDGLGPRLLSTVVNTTFYGQVGRIEADGRFYTGLYCRGPTDRLVVVNSLFFHSPSYPAPADGHVAPACGGALHALGSDDPVLSVNRSVVVPRAQGPGFRDAAALDLRLKGEGEGAAQRALRQGGQVQVRVGAATIEAPTVDLDGRPRPQGGVAIGAYEPVP